MKCTPKRRSVLALAISGLVFTSMAGCGDGDQRAADKKIKEAVAKAAADRQVPTTQGVQSALSKLNEANGAAANASPIGKVEAKSNLAQVQLEAGRRAARELARVDPQVEQTMWEIGLLALRIERLAIDQAAGAKGTPDATIKAIADKRAEMVAAGEAASKKAAELQAEIEKVKGQVATLTQQKDAAATEADSLTDRASKASGKEAADLADQAGEARRKAGHVGHEIDKASAALLPLERDLAVEQQKKKTADEAVATLDANKTSVETSWQAAQGRASEQKQVIAKLGQELTAKAQQLDALTKQAAEIRGRAAEMFTNSAKNSAAAAADARTLGSDLQKWSANYPTEGKAYASLRATFSPSTFILAEAQAEAALGNLHNDHALQLQARQQLAESIAKPLQAAGVAVPAALSGGIAAEQKKAAEEATAAYTSAGGKFMDVYQVGTTPKDQQTSARIARMFALYGQYLAGDKAKLAEAKQEFTETFAERQDDPFARSLPAELRGTAAAAPGAPAPGTPSVPGGTPPARGAAAPGAAG